MSHARIRPLYKHVHFGIGNVIKDIPDDKQKLTIEEFEALGERIKQHLGERIKDFAFTIHLFQHYCLALTGLSAFLILEEIATLLKEIKDDKYLTLIYRALKHQVYTEGRALAYLTK